jgi:hypothetical protein
MRAFLACVLSVVSLASAGAGAQDPPDLSGKWIFDRDETPAEAKGTFTLPNGVMGRIPESQYKTGNFGSTLALSQDGKTLKVEQVLSNGAVQRITFVLDGSEVRHRRPDVNGKPGPEMSSRSSWQGRTLIITTVDEVVQTGASVGPDGKLGPPDKYISRREIKRTLSLAPDGKLVSEMTSSSTSPVSSGGWSPATRSIYKKAD